MGEEILKVELGELLQTIRLKRSNGTIIEASGAKAAMACCPEVGGEQFVSETLTDPVLQGEITRSQRRARVAPKRR